MIPYRDENETQRSAIVTLSVIGLNVFVWLFVQGAGSEFPLAKSVCELGLIPAEITAAVPPGTAFPMGQGLVCTTDPGRQYSHLLTSMFLHVDDQEHRLGGIELDRDRLGIVEFYLHNHPSAFA